MISRLSQAVNRYLGILLERQGYRLQRDYRYPRADLNLFRMAAKLVIAEAACPVHLVQVGAYDGTSSDPVNGLLDDGCVKAIIIEPQATPFAKLAARYRKNCNVYLEQCVVAAEDGIATLYVPIDCEDSQLATTNRGQLCRLGYSETAVRCVSVPALTPRRLLALHGFETVDLLQIDAEGSDYLILKLFLEMELFPEVINIETFHLARADRMELYEILGAKGYRFVDYNLDSLFYKERNFVA